MFTITIKFRSAINTEKRGILGVNTHVFGAVYDTAFSTINIKANLSFTIQKFWIGGICYLGNTTIFNINTNSTITSKLDASVNFGACKMRVISAPINPDAVISHQFFCLRRARNGNDTVFCQCDKGIFLRLFRRQNINANAIGTIQKDGTIIYNLILCAIIFRNQTIIACTYGSGRFCRVAIQYDATIVDKLKSACVINSNHGNSILHFRSNNNLAIIGCRGIVVDQNTVKLCIVGITCIRNTFRIGRIILGGAANINCSIF